MNNKTFIFTSQQRIGKNYLKIANTLPMNRLNARTATTFQANKLK